jgi:hypothetical protein
LKNIPAKVILRGIIAQDLGQRGLGREASEIGQKRDVLIIGIGLLNFLDGTGRLPRCDEALRAGREIVFDPTVQLAEFITGDRSEHVVFDVVVHVPVEELHHGINRECAAAKAKIGHIILQTDVLSGVAERVLSARGVAIGPAASFAPVRSRKAGEAPQEASSSHRRSVLAS